MGLSKINLSGVPWFGESWTGANWGVNCLLHLAEGNWWGPSTHLKHVRHEAPSQVKVETKSMDHLAPKKGPIPTPMGPLKL